MAEVAGTIAPHGYGLRRLDGGLDAFYVLRGGINHIGTLRDNEVVIKAAGVSRIHAELRVTRAGVSFADLASKNGTVVNGVPCEQGTLCCGDEIEVGTARLRLEPTPAADADLAIRLSSWRDDAGAASPGSASSDKGTDQPLPRSVAMEPLAIIEAFGGDLASHLALTDERYRARALAALMPCLGAKGAVWLEIESGGSIVMRAAVGTVPAMNRLALLVSETALSAGRVVLREDRLSGEPTVIALARTDSESAGTALVFPGLELAPHDPRLLRILAMSAANANEREEEHGATGTAPEVSPTLHDTLRFSPGYVAGTSVAAVALHREIGLVCSTDIPLLILGETGVGKEQVAHLVHRSSHRQSGPFVAINCAAIPDDLVEAELFGIDRGVATGVTGRAGRFLQAAGGTLFLDEIGELPVVVQAKLLRALQEKEVQPLGAPAQAVDVRILAATNVSLHERMAAGHFRADLYYRLAGALIEIPPLRRRREDLPALVEDFIRRFARETKQRVRGVTVETLDYLTAYRWPGNIRELEHEIRRLVLRCTDRQPLRADAISPHIRGAASPMLGQEVGGAGDQADDLDLAAVEWRTIERALSKTGGNQSHAARLLGISRFALRRRIERRGFCTVHSER